MTASLRFSVVVPAHDEADLLPGTLASLGAQDFQGGYEVIVVNNASQDGTAALAEALGARVVDEPQLGVCRARQLGVDMARGEIVVSTDADTRHPPVWLSRIDAAFARGGTEVVAVAGPCRYADPPWWAALVSPLWFSGIAAAARWAGWVPYLTATNVAFRRAGFPGYDENLDFGGDEMDLLRRLRGRGRIVWLADNAVITSSRRMDQGLLHTLLVSYGYHYALAQLVNRPGGRPVIGPPAAIATGILTSCDGEGAGGAWLDSVRPLSPRSSGSPVPGVGGEPTAAARHPYLRAHRSAARHRPRTGCTRTSGERADRSQVRGSGRGGRDDVPPTATGGGVRRCRPRQLAARPAWA